MGEVEQAIAEGFGIEALRGSVVGEVKVGGAWRGGIETGRLGVASVGGGGDDGAMEVFHAPMVPHPIASEPIEEREVARGGMFASEIEHIIDERGAEVSHPDLVDGGAGEERVVGVG